MPIVFLESKALKKRIISTNISSSKEILEKKDLILNKNYDYAEQIIEYIHSIKNFENENGLKEVEVWNKRGLDEFRSLIK